MPIPLAAAGRAAALQAGRKRASKKAEQKGRTTLFQYSLAFIVALLDDFLDFTGVLALPVIGMVFDIFFVIIILVCLWLMVPQHASKPYRYLVLLAIIPIEGLLFGLNLLPGMVGSVYLIYQLEKGSEYVFSA